MIRRWGNSAAVRIPSSVLEAAGVGLDQPIVVREEGGRIVIEPVASQRLDLARLVDAMTDENRHDPVQTGLPLGQETW